MADLAPPPLRDDRLARAAWALALRLLLPVLLLRLLWRSRREPLYRHALGERLGLGRPVAPGALWLHAVSLGETRAAEPLIEALRSARPGLRLLLTHGTATGRETGAALLRPSDAQRWLPLDLPGATARFLRRHQPAVGVLIETEVWPALQHATRRAGLPVVLANARLSSRSLRQSLRFDRLLRPAVASLRLVLAQTAADAERLRRAGVVAGQLQVCGNLKFDLRPEPALLALGRRWRSALPAHRPVVLAASWREGEDAALLTAWRAWLERLAGLPRAAGEPARRPLLVLVPRHPQRFDEVAAQVEAAGWRLSRRSQWPAQSPASGAPPSPQPDATAAQADVWLGDSMREMPAWYALADLALLGGSFTPLGGQNLIEAAACACPVTMGPHTFNFSAAAELAEAAGAAMREPTLDAALLGAESLLIQPGHGPRLAAHRRAAEGFAGAHQGAARRMAEAILALMPPEPAADRLPAPKPGAALGLPVATRRPAAQPVPVHVDPRHADPLHADPRHADPTRPGR
ncbi:MAG: hypothetical protein RL722_952 [Pseudomonadota bacterium]|jgi:3-deoxy-D-manno-octulosonic-acid transferase